MVSRWCCLICGYRYRDSVTRRPFPNAQHAFPASRGGPTRGGATGSSPVRTGSPRREEPDYTEVFLDSVEPARREVEIRVAGCGMERFCHRIGWGNRSLQSDKFGGWSVGNRAPDVRPAPLVGGAPHSNSGSGERPDADQEYALAPVGAAGIKDFLRRSDAARTRPHPHRRKRGDRSGRGCARRPRRGRRIDDHAPRAAPHLW